MSLLPRRKLGRTAMQPRALGMGAAFIGGGERDETETIVAIKKFFNVPGTCVCLSLLWNQWVGLWIDEP